jgi:phosphotransferase system enzyme I (PtsP)
MKKDNVELICDVSELANLFHDTSNVDEFLHRVVSIVSKHMHADVCSIFLFDEKSGTLTLKATQGLNENAVNNVHLSLGEGITGTALKELRPIRESSAQENPNFRLFETINEDNYEAFLAVPILRGLSRIGVLTLQHKNRDYFDEKDTKALKAISNQLAATLENAKLLLDLKFKAPVQEVKGHKTPEISGETKDFLSGTVASAGIALGSAVVLGNRSDEIILSSSNGGECTLEDFDRSILATELQIEELQKQMEDRLSDVASLIFSAHLLMLKDSEFSGSMRKIIQGGTPPAKAITQVVNQYIHIFSESNNPRLQEKVQDVKDLGHRLIMNLFPEKESKGSYKGEIVVAKELLPSELVKIAAQETEGLLLFGGGASAHVAILAKSLGIPVLFTEQKEFFTIRDGDKLIIDGFQGNVFIHPGVEVWDEFKNLKKADKASNDDNTRTQPETRTSCGRKIKLLSNINLLSDIKTANKFKAEGIGLYRSEFPFIIRNDFPTEEEQYRVYSKILKGMKGKEVALRTLDIGGDKVLSYMPQGAENNPFLGLRAIRFSLQNKTIFHDQLRAMLRAGVGYELRIMFPLISSLDDFLDARNEVQKCIDDLEKEAIPHNRRPLMGAMIELPSAVEMANELARESDFLSVGTNDLVQYILGVDRTNESVSELYVAHHPAVFRALTRLTRAAINYDCELSICGEIASDPKMIPFLVGIGVSKLSIPPKRIPNVQKFINKLDYLDCQVLADRLINMGTVKEVSSFYASWADRAGLQ